METMKAGDMRDLKQICESAAATGSTIDLTGCHYGLHKRSGQFVGEAPYYAFLAGFVRVLGIKRILEIGTHYSGAIMAMSRGVEPGIDPSKVEMVSVDKRNLNVEGFGSFPRIRSVHGDAPAEDIGRRVRGFFGGPIDLLYVDSKHTYEHARATIEHDGAALAPAFVILDDIHLNASMEKLWAELNASHAGRCFDASDLSRRDCGFGVIAFTPGAGVV